MDIFNTDRKIFDIRKYESEKAQSEYQEIIMNLMDEDGDCCTWNPNWRGFAIMNDILNNAIRNPKIISANYNNMCNFMGMWGFRFTDHFTLSI